MNAAQESGNPFQSNHVAGPYFVGRETELAAFERMLEALPVQGVNHFYIAGVNGRGKSSCLAKLEDMGAGRNILAVKVLLDQRTSGYDQLFSLTEEIVDQADKVLSDQTGAAWLMTDWEDPKGRFRQPKQNLLRANAVLADLSYISETLEGYVDGILLCIDEGERITHDALSALTSAVRSLPRYLIALAIRLGEDNGDPRGAGRRKLDELAKQAAVNLGASRAFTGFGLEPFTPEEARTCIRTRLRNRTMDFEEPLINVIARVSGGFPHSIIEYASGAYESASDQGATIATVEHFCAFFVDHHREETREAQVLRDRSSAADPSERRALGELARQDGPVTPLELARALYPGHSDEILGGLAGNILAHLDRTARTAPLFCRAVDGSADTAPDRRTAIEEYRYEVPSLVRRYALEIAMEEE